MTDHPTSTSSGGLDPRSAAIANRAAAREDADNPTNIRAQVLAEARLNLPDYTRDLIADLNDPNTPLPLKLDRASHMVTALLPLFMGELLAEAPNEARSVALSRTLSAMREFASLQKTKRDVEITDNLNPNSPKFQTVFRWFFDLVHQVLLDEGLDEITINNIFAKLGADLHGFEDRIEKRLKGVAARALDSIQNPFIEDFVKSTRVKPSVSE